MRARPTPGGLAAVAAAVVLNLLTRVTGDAWLALASGAAVAVPLASFLLRPGLREVSAVLTGPGRVVAGSALQQVLVVRNTGARPTPPLQWRDEGAGLGAASVAVPPLAPGAEVRVPVTRSAPTRGLYDGSSAVLSTAAPFGAVRWSRPLPCGPRLVVHPLTGRARALREGAGAAGTAGRLLAGAGLEVLGVRPWRPGDGVRALSARASARHAHPVVLEREAESGLVLVLGVLGLGSGPAWEAAVSDAASTALAVLQGGGSVGLVVGEDVATADSVAVLDHLASAERLAPASAEGLRRALSRAHRGATVLLLAREGQAVPALPAAHVEVLRGA